MRVFKPRRKFDFRCTHKNQSVRSYNIAPKNAKKNRPTSGPTYYACLGPNVGRLFFAFLEVWS